MYNIGMSEVITRATRRPRVLSYGGGLDSFAALVEGIRRGDKPDMVVFVDVGDPQHEDPGEWPSTYRHIEEVVRPLCERHGIELVIISSDAYPVRDARSLFAWLQARRQIPVAGPNRICTTVAKVERFEAWMADRFGAQEVEVWIGFEAGEEARAEKDPNAGTSNLAADIARVRERIAAASPKVAAKLAARLDELLKRPVRRNRFPLMEWNLCRCRCEQLVRAAGYPVPRKSACMYCPYGTKGDWQTLQREQPQVFAKVVQLEADKPPTAKNKIKLSIMGFRTIKNDDGSVRERKAPMLPVFVQGSYRAKKAPCTVCGAAQRATKATGCTYLGEDVPSAA
jgi:hypothetical protein